MVHRTTASRTTRTTTRSTAFSLLTCRGITAGLQRGTAAAASILAGLTSFNLSGLYHFSAFVAVGLHKMIPPLRKRLRHLSHLRAQSRKS